MLFDADGHVALTDFGLAQRSHGEAARKSANGFTGTPEYSAPEVFRKSVWITPAVDKWALGVIIFEIVHRLRPFHGKSARDRFSLILFAEPKIHESVSQVAKDLVLALLRKEPKRRLGGKGGWIEVRAHAFFTAIDWDLVRAKQYRAPYDVCAICDVDAAPIIDDDEISSWCTARVRARESVRREGEFFNGRIFTTDGECPSFPTDGDLP